MSVLGTLFNSEKRHYAKAEKLCKKVLALENAYSSKSDEELQGETERFKQLLENGKSVEDILPEAFATAREAAKRVLHEFPYPVQVLGGVLLHYGDIAEMKTGEGKTLTAVMPIYLNALEGKGAHVVTVNEYLAMRDAEWMGEVYRFLGLSVGCNLNKLNRLEKRLAYEADITYTTNSELGFDYLRDNMVHSVEDRVLRGLHYAVLDECDSILIDESRTPLIISGPGPVLESSYVEADDFVKQLKESDVELSIEDHSAVLSESGIKKAEKYFHVDNFYIPEHYMLVHYVGNALRAHYLFHNGVEYVVSNDEIVLVDQFTGRKMEGREYSDGLHQAIQAKERVGIKNETVTYATITYQNFFRMYDKLSGMTGTAKTAEEELLNTYNMRVFEIPTNKPVQRIDEEDRIYKTLNDKYNAIVEEVESLHAKGQPVLVGTVSVQVSEILSEMLKAKRIPHQVLNAKEDELEAEIISRAGYPHMVTVATNMAGRGTDIKLGDGVSELGGLVVLGSERHESKRIDNQLRGRSGRQGDPGRSIFFVSMEDDLIEKFAGDEGKVEVERYLNDKASVERMRKFVDSVQKRSEGLHYDTRKNTLEYDETNGAQRNIIYKERDQVLEMEDIRDLLEHLLDQTLVEDFGLMKEEEFRPSKEQLIELLTKYSLDEETIETCLNDDVPLASVKNAIKQLYATNMEGADEALLKKKEKLVFLQILDLAWMDQVDFMEQLKNGIGLRGYAQKKPADAYREDGFARFENMTKNIAEQTICTLIKLSEERVHNVSIDGDSSENQ